MRLLPIVQETMHKFPGSFINHNNELILIPRFNVYFCLDDVETDEDFLCKMCEWFSRDCCYAMRYESNKRLEKYWKENTEKFNQVCGTVFSVSDMERIYDKLGNAIRQDLTHIFVRAGFNLEVLE